MAFDVAIKVMISLAVGMIFWFLSFLVYMAYAFMPISKMSHSIIFALVSPVIYLAFINWILSKLFKETEKRQKFINFGLTVATMVGALLIINSIGKAMWQ